MSKENVTSDDDRFSPSLIEQLMNDLKAEVRSLTKHRAPYLWLSRLRYPARSERDSLNVLPEAIRQDTEIVIEGPARSANTFAVMAFRLAQLRSVSIAHHLHAPAQVVAAVKRKIPALVLLRNPEDVVLSRVVSHPPITIKQAIREYVQFFTHVLPYRPNVVVAGFEDVTTDFGTVIARLNRKFGTHFVEFSHTQENIDRCLELIVAKQAACGITEFACPSVQRSALKKEFRNAYLSRDNSKLRKRAEALYVVLSSNRDSSC